MAKDKMIMIFFKTIIKSNFVRLLILCLSSILFTIVINSFHPAKLPIILADDGRPGIHEGSWQEKIRFINVDHIAEEISTGEVVLIDLRESEEFDQLHAAGAINLPYYEFDVVYPDFIDQISTDRSIFIFCEGMLCGLSIRVAKKLLDTGYKNLAVVKQGFEGWEIYQLPMVGNNGKRRDFETQE